MTTKGISRIRALRRIVLPVLARVNPGDVKMTNPYSKDRLKLHSFRHRGYWFHGRRREEATMALFARLVHAGDTVYEVGGHIGFITQFFASLVGPGGRVVVFEPGPNNLPYIKENLRHLANVRLIESAAGPERGEATLHVEQLTGQNNSLVADFKGLAANQKSAGVAAQVTPVVVPVVDLDSFAEESGVDFIKIDVEGFEFEVLQGAEEILRRRRPLLMVEVQRNYEDVAALAERHGYERLDDHLQPVGVHFTGNTFWLHREDHAHLWGR